MCKNVEIALFNTRHLFGDYHWCLEEQGPVDSVEELRYTW